MVRYGLGYAGPANALLRSIRRCTNPPFGVESLTGFWFGKYPSAQTDGKKAEIFCVSPNWNMALDLTFRLDKSKRKAIRELFVHATWNFLKTKWWEVMCFTGMANHVSQWYPHELTSEDLTISAWWWVATCPWWTDKSFLLMPVQRHIRFSHAWDVIVHKHALSAFFE